MKKAQEMNETETHILKQKYKIYNFFYFVMILFIINKQIFSIFQISL